MPRLLTASRIAATGRITSQLQNFVLYDSFRDTNATTISDHTPTIAPAGSSWTQTAGNSFFIQNGAVQPNRKTDGDLAVIDCGLTTYTLQCTITNLWRQANAWLLADVVIHYTNSTNYWYIYPSVTLNTISLYQVINGVHTRRFSYPYKLIGGMSTDIRLDCDGADIRLWVNNQELLTYTHTDTLASSVVGLRLGNSSTPIGACKWENFRVSELLPSRYRWPHFVKGTSPVLYKGIGAEWDVTDVNNPNVVYDDTNHRLVLNYSGYRGNGTQTQHCGIAYGNADNPTAPFTKEAANPVMSAQPTTDSQGFNGGLCKKGAMWYHVYGINNASQFALATSYDLLNWTTHGVVFSGNTAAWDAAQVFDAYLRLRQDGATFELWYAAKNVSGVRQIGYATSTDCITWTPYANNPVITMPAWATQTTTLGEPSVFVPQGKEGEEMLVSFDCGRDGATGNRFIAEALTIDGGATYSYRMIASGAGTGWDAAQVFDSFIYQKDDKLYLYHSGAPVGGAALNLGTQIGVAVADWPYDSFINSEPGDISRPLFDPSYRQQAT